MPEYAYGMTSSSFSYNITREELEAMWIPMQSVKCSAGILFNAKPKRILRSGPCTIVFWEDGTKTIVRKAPDEEDNAYAAFTAALAIKIFGSNQAVKRIVEMTETQEKKEKQGTANKELLKFLDDLLESDGKEQSDDQTFLR